MTLVNVYSESTPTQQTRQHDHIRPNRAAIRDFLDWLHELAEGLDGELVLVAIEQEPDAVKAQVRVQRFGVGDSTAMARVALQEATKDWVNLYFGSYVVRLGLSPGCRGSRSDIIAVLMLSVDQDADKGQEGSLPLEPNLIVQTSQIPTINRQAFYVFNPQNRPLVAEADAV